MSGLHARAHLERQMLDSITLDDIRHMLMALGLGETEIRQRLKAHGPTASTEAVLRVLSETREGVGAKLHSASGGRRV